MKGTNMEEKKITKAYIIKVLGKWLKEHKGCTLPAMNYEAAQQLYEALTEDCPKKNNSCDKCY